MSDPPAARMRWCGWGVDGHDAPLPPAAAALLRDELGAGGERRAPVALADVQLPEPALAPRARAALERAVGAACVRDDRLARVAHAAGRSYTDLIRLRAGRDLSAPDAVVYPAGHDEVAAVLEACARERVAVVPFGGGTSVVGGVEPLRGPHAAVVSVDLARAGGLLALDERSALAALAAGTAGPELERLLGARGLTLGHHPQSFEFSTLGGWAATRSAGQASTGYGRIDELVVALRAAAPGGELRTPPAPASAAGPALRELLLGSEGTLAIITEATVRVRPRPPERRYEGWSLPSFGAGLEALRELAQAGAAPDVARLSDEQETRLSLSLASGSAGGRLLRAYLLARRGGVSLARGAARGRSRGGSGAPAGATGCLAIAGFEGAGADVARRRARARAVLRRHGALALGPAPGAAWLRERYRAPYLRDELLARGVLVDTLETAAPWSALPALHRAVGDALDAALGARGTPALVGCHVSHLYATGASLYFTFLARAQPGAELEQWRAAKAAASDAIVAAGATITHHHGVGRDHAPWLERELGPLGLDALRALKGSLDPDGIMNPGKLV